MKKMGFNGMVTNGKCKFVNDTFSQGRDELYFKHS